MPKARAVWRCGECGHAEPKWLGRCPECGEYGTYVEEAVEARGPAASSRRAPAGRPVRLAEMSAEEERFPTGIGEFDRVLGGGLVRGSLVLLGGEPGIGKSTLLLQAADALARSGRQVLYVCGEESPRQVRLRAERLGVEDGGRLGLLPEIDVAVAEATAEEVKPDLLIVDSIQTVFDPDVDGAPGSVGQVRACAARLMRVAKDRGTTTLLVGHVTKDGSIAGPRMLEHMVDTVLYFEGDRDRAFRIVRAVKNRFGSASEIGIFEMGDRGLEEVASPSATLLAQGGAGVPGSVVMATVEGSRPLLVEIQALVNPTYLQMPRRLANGIDNGRLLQLLAVLERRAGLAFGQHDVYVSVAGGVRIGEPAVDLPLALALASARRDVAAPAGLVAFGELGLSGDVRPVSQEQARLREAARLGFELAMTGASGREATSEREDRLDVRRVAMLREAVDLLG